MTVPVTNTAVDEAIDRLVVLLKAAGQLLTPPIDKVTKAAEPKWKAPYIWITPGTADFTWATSDLQTQVYTADIRIVLGEREKGYDRVLTTHLWTAIPVLANYLMQRTHLITVKGQLPVPGLNTEDTVIGPATPFGPFDGSDEVGFTLPVLLSFSAISIPTVYPTT